MKKMLVILLAILMAPALFAAEPLVTVGKLPQKADLELYTENEGLFLMKLMEYYKKSVMLETQLTLLGQTPKSPALAPTFEEIEDADVKTIKKYHVIASDLQKLVEAAPESLPSMRIIELRKQMKDLEMENFELQEQAIGLQTDCDKLQYYKEALFGLHLKLDSLKFLADKIRIENDERIAKAYQTIYSDKKRAFDAVFGLGISTEFFALNDSRISTNLTPALSLNFNPGKIFGMGRVVDLWAHYAYLTNTAAPLPGISDFADPQLRYRTRLFSFGGNLNMLISKALHIHDFELNFKVGAGYFTATTSVDNSSIQNYDWSGGLLKLEFAASNFNKMFPMGIFFGADFYKFTDRLTFPNLTQSVDLGTPWVPSFILGLRFNLLQVSPLFN